MNLVRLRSRLQKDFLGRILLGILSGLYGAGVWLRNLSYQLGLRQLRRLPVKTICIGNLTSGGTGKTSAVLLAASTLHKRQVKVAILSRGYKRPKKTEEVTVLLNSVSVPWQETGDEPWMMHHALKGMDIPILVCPDRYRAGQTALTYYNPQVILLDDGFQHRRLRRDLDIVLISALDPFGQGSLLPLGDLREPLRGLRRAGMAVITHVDQVEPERVAEIREALLQVHPDIELAEAIHKADFLFDLKSETRHKLSYLKNKPVACFSALGDPRPFEEQLKRIESRLVQVWRYPDHHPYTLSEMRSIENLRQGAPLVTTFKDFPRLPAGWQDVLSGEVLALAVRMEIVKGKSTWDSVLCEETLAA
jgi:tetraacyldisaccharide 4'-kinase